MIAVDSGVVIWLAKYDKLYILKSLFGRAIISEKVFNETFVVGKEMGYKDAINTEKAIGSGDIVIKEAKILKEILRAETRLDITLGEGEREAISLALKLKLPLLTNDEEAAIIAEHLGINCNGILFILLKAVKEKILSREEALNFFQQMLEDGFWLDPETVAAFQKKMYEL